MPPQGCALAKKPISVPPPPRSKLYELEFIETKLRGSLRMCRDNRGTILEYLRSYAVEVFDFYNTSYESVPGYTREWRQRLLVEAIQRVMGCCSGERIGLGYLDEYREDVFQTLKAHVGRLPQRRTADAQFSRPLKRKALRDSYLAAHPRVVKLDICFAAGQHYTEWKRWLRGVLKDGSTPDRAFRALLESGKWPREYNSRPRPSGWK